MNQAQGAIEYLLIIGAAILVVAVVVIALTGILNTAKQETAATQVLSTLGPLEKEILLSEGKLSVGQLSSDGVLGHTITRSDGRSITTQAELDEAYRNGEIIIRINGTEPSIVQKSGTQIKTLTSIGCYTGTYTKTQYGADQLVYGTGQTDQTTYSGKFAKIVSTNNNSTFNYLLNTTHLLVPGNTPLGVCCGRCQFQNCIRLSQDTFHLTDADCPSSMTQVPKPESNWTPGTMTNNWNLEIYNYTLVFGEATSTNQIGINPATGTITFPAQSFVKNDPEYDQFYLNKWCCTGNTCESNSDYVGLCDTINLDAAHALLNYCDSYDTTDYCYITPKQVPALSIDYFHLNN